MRITPAQQEVMVVLDKWIADHRPVLVRYDYVHERDIKTDLGTKAQPYWLLVEALAKFVKDKEDVHAKEFHKAVELAYQKGFSAGSGAKE